VPDTVGAGAAAFQAWSVENPRLTRATRDRAGFGPCLKHGNGPAADQMLLLTLYAHCVLASTVFLTDTLATEQR